MEENEPEEATDYCTTSICAPGPILHRGAGDCFSGCRAFTVDGDAVFPDPSSAARNGISSVGGE